ncbi:MAG: rhodanese-like domain-containing protein [Lachnospirales bacterium]
MYKKISQIEAKKIMDENSDIYIVDVREEDELVEGYIENSLLIPLDTVEKNAEKIIPDKNKPVLIYCRSGRRSAIAGEILEKLGYKNILDFGGIMDWPFEKIM